MNNVEFDQAYMNISDFEVLFKGFKTTQRQVKYPIFHDFVRKMTGWHSDIIDELYLLEHLERDSLCHPLIFYENDQFYFNAAVFTASYKAQISKPESVNIEFILMLKKSFDWGLTRSKRIFDSMENPQRYLPSELKFPIFYWVTIHADN